MINADLLSAVVARELNSGTDEYKLGKDIIVDKMKDKQLERIERRSEVVESLERKRANAVARSAPTEVIDCYDKLLAQATAV